MAVKMNTDQLQAAIRVAAFRGVVAATESVRAEALRLILQTAKTGRIYRRKGVFHQASAPGEAPASDTGTLVNRITTDFEENNLVGRVSARTEYASFLEFGTQRMEPRPFMRPALENQRSYIEGVIKGEVGKVLKGFEK